MQSHAYSAIKPKYAHDCNRCKFMGRLTCMTQSLTPCPHTYDVYICQSHENSLVVRGSDDPADYSSGSLKMQQHLLPAQVWGTNPPVYIWGVLNTAIFALMRANLLTCHIKERDIDKEIDDLLEDDKQP